MCRLENIQKSHNQRDLDRPREIDDQNVSHKNNITINGTNTYHTKENL